MKISINKLRAFAHDIKDDYMDDPISHKFDRTFIRPFRVLKERIGRMLFWGWHMRNSYDFDAHTMYHMIHLKLKRMEDTFENHGNCCWQEVGDENYTLMLKLKEAIKLAKHLDEHDSLMYLPELEEAHDAKWGELNMNVVPCDEVDSKGRKYSKCEFSRKNAVTLEQREQEYAEHDAIRKEHWKRYTNDKAKLFSLLRSNIQYWWD